MFMDTVTILCGVPDERLARESFQDSGAELELADGRTTAILPEGRLLLTSKEFAPNSEFSRIILGLHNYFRGTATDDEAAKAKAVGLLDRCDLMFGVVFEPPADHDDSRRQAVFSVASRLEALIFDGAQLLDPDGQVVLGPPPS